MHHAPLPRRLAAEALGTGLLVTAVIGSGIAAEQLSAGQVGLQLLENALATAAGLAVIILLVGPVSGAHLNPLISLADWWLGRPGGGLQGRDVAAYTAAQTVGAVVGAVLANLMFDLPAVSWSDTDRSGAHLWLSEVVATAGLVALVFALARTGRSGLAAAAVGAYIGSAYWWSSSTSFANPAVTLARTLSDTFAGIAPTSVPPFLAAQLVGAAVGVLTVRGLYPDTGAAADRVVVPTDPSGSPSGVRAGPPADGSRRPWTLSRSACGRARSRRASPVPPRG